MNKEKSKQNANRTKKNHRKNATEKYSNSIPLEEREDKAAFMGITLPELEELIE